MQYTNKLNLPDWMVAALTANDYYTAPGRIGVTTLIDSPRIRILKEQHDSELVRDCSDNHNVFLGTAVHALIAKANENNPNLIVEQRFEAQIPYSELMLSGQPDIIDGDTLWDIKTTKASALAYGNKEAWNRQVNCYRWLLSQNGITVNKLMIMVEYKDWSEGTMRFQQMADYTYPTAPFSTVEVKVWDLGETEHYVTTRAQAHTQNELMPWCSPEERWEKSGGFAVMSGSKKKADRVLPTLAEAEMWVSRNPQLRSPYIVERKPEWKRCGEYCDVKQWCSQYQAFIAAQAE